MEKSEKKLTKIINALEKDKAINIQNTLSSLNPSEIARLLESLTTRERNVLWQMVNQEDEGEILKELIEEVRQNLISQMDTSELIAATQDMELDDLADILSDLPNQITDQVIKALDTQDQNRLESVISYDEDTAGGLTNPKIISIRRGVNIDGLIKYLRNMKSLPENTNYIYVIDRDNQYIGAIQLVDLFTQSKDMLIEEIMDSNVKAINANVKAEEVAIEFQDLDLISAPVIDSNNKLLGQITIDDVVDVI